MIAKDLFDCCTVSGVAKVIEEMAHIPKEGLADLEKQCQQIIDESKKSDNYYILDDKNFCFVAVETDKHPTVPYVTLTDLDKLIQNDYDITKVTDFSWHWGQFLGISVAPASYQKYGADVLVGGILYHMMYMDQVENREH